jgi:hypothetical protein
MKIARQAAATRGDRVALPEKRHGMPLIGRMAERVKAVPIAGVVALLNGRLRHLSQQGEPRSRRHVIAEQVDFRSQNWLPDRLSRVEQAAEIAFFDACHPARRRKRSRITGLFCIGSAFGHRPNPDSCAALTEKPVRESSGRQKKIV